MKIRAQTLWFPQCHHHSWASWNNIFIVFKCIRAPRFLYPFAHSCEEPGQLWGRTSSPFISLVPGEAWELQGHRCQLVKLLNESGGSRFVYTESWYTTWARQIRRGEIQMLCSSQNGDQVYFVNKVSNRSPRCREPDVKMTDVLTN